MDTNKVKAELTALRDSIEERMAKLKRHVHQREEPIPQDFSEQAVDMQNDETMVALDDELDSQLADVAAALARIEADSYGACTQCGEDIEEARLEALPATPFCIDCASKADMKQALPR